jgi:hypothetical protein
LVAATLNPDLEVRVSEPDDKPPADAAGLQSPMRISSALRWEGIRDPERKNASLHLCAQMIEFLEFPVVIPHERRGKSNAALPAASEAAH